MGSALRIPDTLQDGIAANDNPIATAAIMFMRFTEFENVRLYDRDEIFEAPFSLNVLVRRVIIPPCPARDSCICN
jgi:hypothetical protein